MKNKKLILAAIALVAVIAVFAGVYIATRPDTVAGEKNITVIVIHKDGTEKNFKYSTDAEYLSEVLLENGLVTGSESEYGLTIASVDGETADFNTDSAYWSLYEGEEYASTGASGIVLVDGGVYKLVYTAYESE